MKDWWKDYFSFTKKERTGVLVLMVLIFAVFIAPYFFQQQNSGPGKDELKLVSEKAFVKPTHEDSLNEEDHEQYSSQENYSRKETIVPGKLFKFDPNTLSVDGWRKLGVKEKVIQTIRHYIEKGGQFRRPEDLKRIYGLKPDQVDQLILYAEIKDTEPENKYHNREMTSRKEGFPPRSKEYTAYKTVLVDINLADSTAWIALPGIGSKLAARIINFREKLGGFYSVEQVSETFGLADSVFQKIKSRLLLSALKVKQIDINKASLDELKQHPYIRWNIAMAMVRYREQHGSFATVDDLSGINILNKELLEKIRPYLVAN